MPRRTPAAERSQPTDLARLAKPGVERTHMTYRELSVPGAWEITPTRHGDPRGVFLEYFQSGPFRGAVGHAFDLQQANCSVSAAGVLRGIHYADVPPGQAKYVPCALGPRDGPGLAGRDV